MKFWSAAVATGYHRQSHVPPLVMIAYLRLRSFCRILCPKVLADAVIDLILLLLVFFAFPFSCARQYRLQAMHNEKCVPALPLAGRSSSSSLSVAA